MSNEQRTVKKKTHGGVGGGRSMGGVHVHDPPSSSSSVALPWVLKVMDKKKASVFSLKLVTSGTGAQDRALI